MKIIKKARDYRYQFKDWYGKNYQQSLYYKVVTHGDTQRMSL